MQSFSIKRYVCCVTAWEPPVPRLLLTYDSHSILYLPQLPMFKSNCFLDDCSVSMATNHHKLSINLPDIYAILIIKKGVWRGV